MDCHLLDDALKPKKISYGIEEFISFQKLYIRDINILADDFINFININSIQEDSVIPKKDMDVIIGYSTSLKILNEDLLSNFKKRKAEWADVPKISDIIVKNGPFLHIYSIYLYNLNTQFQHLEKCMLKYETFLKAVKKFESSRNLSLTKTMLKPIARLLQFKELLMTYLDHQTPNSADYEDTEEAIRIVYKACKDASRLKIMELVCLNYYPNIYHKLISMYFTDKEKTSKFV